MIVTTLDELKNSVPPEYIQLLRKYGIKKITNKTDNPITLEIIIEIIKLAKQLKNGRD